MEVRSLGVHEHRDESCVLQQAARTLLTNTQTALEKSHTTNTNAATNCYTQNTRQQALQLELQRMHDAALEQSEEP